MRTGLLTLVSAGAYAVGALSQALTVVPICIHIENIILMTVLIFIPVVSKLIQPTHGHMSQGERRIMDWVVSV